MAAAPQPGDPACLTEILRATAVQAAGLAVLTAVQHLQRTSILVETATAVGLARALTPGAEPGQTWDEALEVSRRAMDEAVEAYRQAMSAAIDLGKTISS